MTASTQNRTPLSLTWQRLMRTAGSQARALRRSLAGLFVAALLQGAALACSMPLLHAVLDLRDAARALAWLGAATACLALSMLLRWLAFRFDFHGDMIRITQALRTQLGRKLYRMPLLRLQANHSADTAHTLLSNVDTAFSSLLGVANAMFLALLMPLAAAAAMVSYDWRLAAALLPAYAAVLAFYLWRRPTFRASVRQGDDAHRRLQVALQEHIQGLPIIRSTCQDTNADLRLHRRIDALEQSQRTDTERGLGPNVAMATSIELSLLAVAAAGAALAWAGHLGAAVFAALLVIVMRFGEPLSNLVLYTYLFDMVETALSQVEALQAEPELPLREPLSVPARFDVVFDQVCFRYDDAGAAAGGAKVSEPDDDDAPRARSWDLDRVSLQCDEHCLTAIVGPSGSGKSTLVKLLQRQADPTSGSIRIGGIDLRHIPPAQRNALISVVFQDVYLFAGSILDNIRMARPDATEDDIRHAARLAHCDTFIQRLPQGYLTPAGDCDGRLSGGERQRISIARAILKNAPIIVLDEPTSALDTLSEAQVQQAIDALVRDRTVIMVSHRLSAMRGASCIAVMADGALVEQGTHASLLVQNGVYQRLCAADDDCTFDTAQDHI